MRTSFELTYTAKDYQDARFKALEHVAKFLNVGEADVEERVSLELKINLSEKEENTEDNYSVTAHGQLKSLFAFTPKH
jgi:hypothetical protein